jgi:uncharacterized protein YccT (UPF0319 family)
MGGSPTNVPITNIPVASGLIDEQGNMIDLTPEQEKLRAAEAAAVKKKDDAFKTKMEAYNAQENARQVKAFESTYPTPKEATTTMSPNSYGREASKPTLTSEQAIEDGLK